MAKLKKILKTHEYDHDLDLDHGLTHGCFKFFLT